MVNRRQFLTGVSIATAAIVAGGLAGCSKDSGQGSNSGSASGAVAVELWDYLGQGVSNDAMVKAIAEFNKTNPDIKVNRTSFAYGDLSKSIVQGGVGGNAPDIAICDNVDNQNFAALGLLHDITDDVSSEKEKFFEGPWNSGLLDGKNYGLPLNSNSLGLFYNEDMFAAAQLQPPTDWDSLAKSAKALSKNGVTGLAVAGVKNEQSTFQILPFVWQTGGDLKNYAESGAEALAYLKKLIESGAMSASVTNWSQEDCRTQFTTKKVAMMFNGPWELNNLKDTSFKWSVVPLPKGQVAASGLGGENVVVFEKAKQRDAAMKLLKFLTGAEGAKIYCEVSGQLSSLVDLGGKLTSSKDPSVQVFEKQLEVAKARSYGKNYAKISEAVQLSIQQALTGAKSPQDAAKAAGDVITPLLGQ